jgi:hypothetical protein
LFGDDLICREVAKPISRRNIPMKQMLRGGALNVFTAWKDNLFQNHNFEISFSPFPQRFPQKSLPP